MVFAFFIKHYTNHVHKISTCYCSLQNNFVKPDCHFSCRLSISYRRNISWNYNNGRLSKWCLVWRIFVYFVFSLELMNYANRKVLLGIACSNGNLFGIYKIVIKCISTEKKLAGWLQGMLVSSQPWFLFVWMFFFLSQKIILTRHSCKCCILVAGCQWRQEWYGRL